MKQLHIKRLTKKATSVVRRSLINGRISRPTNIAMHCTFSIDSPLKQATDQSKILVEGWLIPDDGYQLKGLHLSYGDKITTIPYGKKRLDVAKAFPSRLSALKSGFSLEIDASEGKLGIDADLGDGYKRIYSSSLEYRPEKLVSDILNPNLSQNWAEHTNLLSNKRSYYYEEPVEGSFKRTNGDPRLVAFYLPQFHPISQNDYVWGKNFTEWTNVTSDTPRFVGHQQPFLPKDSGFYDLRVDTVMADQIEMAKKHGIYGFCFYYYWFSGERLLENPLDNFIKHKKWDFNFSICWANENWTKRWDGRDSEVIIAQKYNKDDPLKFIKDIEHILLDPRYINEEGKPVLTVFRASELDDPARYASIWRKYLHEKYDKELHLVSIISFEDRDPREYGFDAALDFAPQSVFFKNDIFENKKYPYLDVSNQLIDINFEGMVADYRSIALNTKAYDYFDYPTYKCVTPSWDNDARKKSKGFVMALQNPDIYGDWLSSILKLETCQRKDPLIFINAWNEWAEGAVLEPTIHQGRAILNRTTQALSRFSQDTTNLKNYPYQGVVRSHGVKLAVVVHLFYLERWPEIKNKLGSIKEPYDLFVTLNVKNSDFTDVISKFKSGSRTFIVPNRGRDVLPFLYLARRLDYAGYSQILKLHSKKSNHRDDGDGWFTDVLTGLLPNKSIVSSANSGPHSLLGPSGHTVSLKRHMGSNQAHLNNVLCKLYGIKEAERILEHPEQYNYFGGTMFWVSMELIRPLLRMHLMPEDFESEKGQIDGTMAHAIERLFGIMAIMHDGNLYEISAGGIKPARFAAQDEKYKFAP